MDPGEVTVFRCVCGQVWALDCSLHWNADNGALVEIDVDLMDELIKGTFEISFSEDDDSLRDVMN